VDWQGKDSTMRWVCSGNKVVKVVKGSGIKVGNRTLSGVIMTLRCYYHYSVVKELNQIRGIDMFIVKVLRKTNNHFWNCVSLTVHSNSGCINIEKTIDSA